MLGRQNNAALIWAATLLSVVACGNEMRTKTADHRSQAAVIQNAGQTPVTPPPGAPGQADDVAPVCTNPMAAGPSGIIIHGKETYINALTTLVGADAVASAKSQLLQVPDVRSAATIFRSAGTHLSDDALFGYFVVGQQIAAFLTQDAAHLEALGAGLSTPPTASNAHAVRDFIQSFGEKAFHTPLFTDDVQRLLDVYSGTAPQLGHAAGVAAVIQAVLQSPRFLATIEDRGTPVPSGTEAVSGLTVVNAYELAARLSFFLWNAPPDDALLQAAANGSLSNATDLAAEVDRMLDSPKAVPALIDFYQTWLGIDPDMAFNYSGGFADGIDTAALKTSAAKEFQDFVTYITLSGTTGYSDLLMSTKAFVTTPELAAVYGVSPSSSADTPVALPQASRAGILTRVMALTSGNDFYSPILRGKALRENILCDQLGAPPPDAQAVAAQVAQSLGETPSFRQLAANQTASPSCASCHVKLINPLGYLTGNYDALGRYITTEKHYSNGKFVNDAPVDATAVPYIADVDEPKLDGLISLSNALATSPKANLCFVKQVFRDAFGRVETPADGCLLAALYQAVRTSGSAGSIRNMLKTLATSPQFRFKVPANE